MNDFDDDIWDDASESDELEYVESKKRLASNARRVIELKMEERELRRQLDDFFTQDTDSFSYKI